MAVVPERMFITMFQDEIIARVEDVQSEYPVRKSLQTLKGIGRIGKNQVELLPADRKEIEHIVPHHRHIVQTQPGSLSFDERGIFPRHLD